MTIPIYVTAMLATLITAFASDRYKQRSPFVIGAFALGSLSFLALLVIPHPKLPGLTYAMLFPAASGIYAPLIPLLSWFGKSPSLQSTFSLAQSSQLITTTTLKELKKDKMVN